MENKESINNEAITRFKCNHLQEIRALCELLEFSLLYALNNGKYKKSVDDTTLWEMSDDFTQYAIGTMDAFSVEPRFTANEMLILEGIIHDRACDYLQKQGVVLD